MIDITYESIFQGNIVTQMQTQGWQLGHASGYTAETSLYGYDVLIFAQSIYLQQ